MVGLIFQMSGVMLSIYNFSSRPINLPTVTVLSPIYRQRRLRVWGLPWVIQQSSESRCPYWNRILKSWLSKPCPGREAYSTSTEKCASNLGISGTALHCLRPGGLPDTAWALLQGNTTIGDLMSPKHGLWSRKAGGWSLPPPLTSCLASNQLYNLTRCQFPSLLKGDFNTYLVGLSWISEVRYRKI